MCETKSNIKNYGCQKCAFTNTKPCACKRVKKNKCKKVKKCGCKKVKQTCNNTCNKTYNNACGTFNGALGFCNTFSVLPGFPSVL